MKIFSFVKKVFVLGLTILSNITNALECISVKNQEWKISPEIININSNNPIFYPFSVKINRCNGNCNNINDPYARICVSDTVKNLNVKVFNLMSRTNETRQIKWHKKCKCICRLDQIICNNKQKWNKDKCRCDCKKLIDKRVCDKGFIFNASNCECECDKSCNIGQCLDYSDCKCKKNFTMILLILKILIQSYWRLIKNHTKTLIFLILDMSQRKKLVIVKILIVLILCI